MTLAGRLKTVALPVSGGIAAPLVVAYSGLAVRLGAHPWWAQSSAWIGAVIGIALALALFGVRLHRVAVLVIGALMVAAGAWAAHAGKVAFADSYAEDALAGRFWYWGWIGALAGVTLLVATLLLPRRSGTPLVVGNLDHA